MPERLLSEQEYNAVRESVLASAPPNMDEATFTRWVGPQMAAAIEEAELRAPSAEGSSAGRFLSNAGAMLNPIAMAKGVYEAARHPIDTTIAIGQQMGEQLGKAGQAAREGRYVEAMGHGAAGVLPVIGPAAAAIGEQAAGGDIAGAAGAASGLMAPGLIRPAVSTVKRLAPSGLRNAAASSLEAGAASRITDTMTPKVGPNKLRFGGMAEAVAPELAARPELAAWSRTGFEANVGQAFETAVAKLDEAANARLSARTFSTTPIIEALKSKRQRWVSEAVEASKFPPTREVTPGVRVTARNVSEPVGADVIPPENVSRVARINQAISDLEQLGPAARYESLRRIREAADQSAKIKYSPSMTQDFLKHSGEASGAADVTGVLREHLAQFEPATAAANVEYAILKKASDVLEAAAETERVRPKVGRQLMARFTGTVAGGEAAGFTGALAGYILGPAVESAMSAGLTTKLKTAQLMSQLASALRANHMGKVYTLTEQLTRGAKLATGQAVRATAAGTPVTTAPPMPASQ